jgi:mRNA interferase HigB
MSSLENVLMNSPRNFPIPSRLWWYANMKKGTFSNFAELRAVFPTADRVGKLTVFNIGGNKVRLIAALHYNRRKIYVRAVLTHAEYDESRWKE